MIALLLLLLALIGTGCGHSSDPGRTALEKAYARLASAGSPAAEADTAALAALAGYVDSLGGTAILESLLVESMAGDPARWRAFLDSIATSLP